MVLTDSVYAAILVHRLDVVHSIETCQFTYKDLAESDGVWSISRQSFQVPLFVLIHETDQGDLKGPHVLFQFALLLLYPVEMGADARRTQSKVGDSVFSLGGEREGDKNCGSKDYFLY